MFTVLKSSWVSFLWTIGSYLLISPILTVSAIDCPSKILRSRTGIISSPTGSESICRYWSIQADVGNVVTISFSVLNIQTGPFGECVNNYVQFGPRPISKFCGNSNHTYIAQVKRDHVWVSYISADPGNNGFQLRFIVGNVPTTEACRSNERECHNGKCIPEEWRCNGYNECGDNSDESYCLATTKGPSPDRCGWEWMCSNGNCVPWPLKCNGINDCGDYSDEANCPPHIRTAAHRTTTIQPHTVGCGPTYLNKTYGNFSSPLYPGLYPSNTDCSWIIIAGHGDKVQLRFNHFRLQDEKNTDSVTVYDGRPANGKLLGVYYGSRPPPELIESSSNTLFVRFHSDSVYRAKGFFATYQRKGVCMPHQKQCKDETECYYDSQRCDGVWNCPEHGSDEKGCGRCSLTQYSCGPTSKCYPEAERCNGKSFCLNNADENNCTSDRCGPHKGLFLCRNKRCIYESWECDRTSDCEDHSDEEGCPSPFFTRRVIVAAVAGSLICSLLLVIALGCICKVYALRMHEQYGPRHESPLSRLQAEFFRRRAPPPPYHEAMLTSRPYEEVRRESMNSSREHRRRRTGDRRRNRALPPTPEEPSMQHAGTAAASGCNLELGSDNDVQLLSLNSTNLQNANVDSSSTTELIPPTTSSDSEDGRDQAIDDDVDDDSDSVLLDLSEADGGTAAWRSISRHTSDEENSPVHVLSDGGCDSVDSASANLSVDDMSLALHETLDKENGVQAEIVDKENSVDHEFPTTSQSSISPSLPEEQLITTEHPIKNQ